MKDYLVVNGSPDIVFVFNDEMVYDTAEGATDAAPSAKYRNSLILYKLFPFDFFYLFYRNIN